MSKNPKVANPTSQFSSNEVMTAEEAVKKLNITAYELEKLVIENRVSGYFIQATQFKDGITDYKCTESEPPSFSIETYGYSSFWNGNKVAYRISDIEYIQSVINDETVKHPSGWIKVFGDSKDTDTKPHQTDAAIPKDIQHHISELQENIASLERENASLRAKRKKDNQGSPGQLTKGQEEKTAARWERHLEDAVRLAAYCIDANRITPFTQSELDKALSDLGAMFLNDKAWRAFRKGMPQKYLNTGGRPRGTSSSD